MIDQKNGYNLTQIKKVVNFMNMVKFGAHIARLRKEHDMPQSRLADMLNVTRQAVSKWERGEGFPDITILRDIAEAFGVTVDSLINAGEAARNEAAILASAAQNQEISQEILTTDGAIQDIINVAPYLKVSTLTAISEKLANHNINIDKIIELSEFMNDESILRLLENSNIDAPDDVLLEKLVPFLDNASIYSIFEKFLEGKSNVGLIEKIRPYIAYELFEAAKMHGVI